MRFMNLTRRTAVVAATAGLALGATLLAPTGANAGTITNPDMATAQLVQFQGSGISATVNLSDNGLLLTANGTSTGMDPNSQYISLIYGLQSNSDVTPPLTGPGPCVDDGTLGDVIPVGPGAVQFSPVATLRMLQGMWLPPLLGGPPTLVTVKSTDQVTGITLLQGKTVSIRKATLPLNPLNLFNDIRPQIFNLMACGIIVPQNYTPAYSPIPGT